MPGRELVRSGTSFVLNPALSQAFQKIRRNFGIPHVLVSAAELASDPLSRTSLNQGVAFGAPELLVKSVHVHLAVHAFCSLHLPSVR